MSLLTACSTTSNLPEGETLYTGIKKTHIHDRQNTYDESVALTEVQAALAYSPNNSFMGSSSVRTPLPIGLWIYNGMVNKENSKFGNWLLKSFGSTPVTITSVNPATRTKVATNTLQNYGYFNGYVDYELADQKNPRKQKIKYDIHLEQPYHYDSIRYAFRDRQDSIVQANFERRYLKQDGQFCVAGLQAEKDRLLSDFRNNGYYYYRSDYIRYFADSMQIPQKVKLLVAPDLDMPEKANRQWYIGNIHTYVRKSMGRQTRRERTTSQRDSVSTVGDTLRASAGTSATRNMARFMAFDDSIVLGGLKYAWQGDKQPIRPRVLFKNYRFRRKEMFNQSHFDQTITNLANMQVFSQVQFTFTPRDTTATCDTLDVRVNAIMDKLIDAEFDFSFTQKSNAQVGPKAGLKLSKRNAFGHGETFSAGLKGSYEWQTGNRVKTMNSRPDSWEAGLDASLTYPWIAFPWLADKNYTYSTSTVFKTTIDNLKRAGYYRLVSFGVDVTYNFQTNRFVHHQLTPLTLAYNRLINTTERFDSIAASNPALYASLSSQFIPAMQYVYIFDNASSARQRFSTRFVASVKESGNLTSSIMAASGHDYGKKGKKLLGTPFSQFVKFSLELTNKFKLTDKSQLVTRLAVGSLWTYGNSNFAPYSELFYVGGANSIRSFGARTIGPGRYLDREGRGTFLDQAGDFKFEANAEYRFPLISNLNGALFLDAGNVWLLDGDEAHPGGKLGDGSILRTLALGSGFGFRYDLEFLVLRLDLGVGIHAPYETGKKSYYNIPRFKDGLGLHFAVGYPF